MERETGIEPVTSSLGSWRSTAELLPLSKTEPTITMTGCAIDPWWGCQAAAIHAGA